MFDIDDDGVISIKDIMKKFKSMCGRNKACYRPFLKEFHKADKDGDKVLTGDEIIHFYKEYMKYNGEEDDTVMTTPEEVLEYYDRDKDGEITKHEVFKVLQENGKCNHD